MRLYFAAALALSVATARAEQPAIAPDQIGYASTARPFLDKYCGKCHTGPKPKGELSVDARRLGNAFSDVVTRNQWGQIVDVLNSHQMPPEKARQPSTSEVSAVVDWITNQTVRAEMVKRGRAVVLRRLNRQEYHNTIHDLLGVDFDPAGFPEDPPAGGFDNNGGALTISPFHLEMYLAAAQQIVDRAIVSGERPAAIRWRFDLTVGPMDRRRVQLDEKNRNVIVNGGNNKQEHAWVVVHHDYWDNWLGVRGFQVPVAGDYAIRIHAAGRVPTRDEVVKSAEPLLRRRRDDDIARNPRDKRYYLEAHDLAVKHFQTDRAYDYGPPRLKLVQQLGPQPRTIAEFDVVATPSSPANYTFLARFTTEDAGITINYAYDIPKSPENFALQRNDLFARPEAMVDWVEIEGPLYDAWPPSSHTMVLPHSPSGMTESAHARLVLGGFLRRAYRRPVAAGELEPKLALYTSARLEKPFVEAIKAPLMATLASPHFLYLVEGRSDIRADQPSALDDHELAARLSYFLWSSMPDDQLFRLASAGKLQTSAMLDTQVDRMLADKKADALVRNFTGQWLGLRDVGVNPPVENLYPRYDRHLETSIVEESEAYFREFLVNDLDVRQMLHSDFVMINERLARFYGIPGVRGDEVRRVKVPTGIQRGGIVTQASILTTTSNGTRTSPVKRGTWVLKTLLGVDPGLPVANVGEIAPKVPGIDKATVRQRLEIHRTLPQCARCHSKIDPLGFALENYNAAGEWRSHEPSGALGRILANDRPIDRSAVMPDGRSINGVAGLQRALLEKDELFLSCLASKLMTYAYGRELGLADQPTVKMIVTLMKKNHCTLRSLVKSIVNSEPFRTK